MTGESAFYYQDLTDVIPEKYHIATKAKAAPLGDVRITQIYVRDDLLQLGVEEREINATYLLEADENLPIHNKRLTENGSGVNMILKKVLPVTVRLIVD